ncbi:MAG: hypothetical protein U1A27_02590 [Phycisphaerae bacterium]
MLFDDLCPGGDGQRAGVGLGGVIGVADANAVTALQPADRREVGRGLRRRIAADAVEQRESAGRGEASQPGDGGVDLGVVGRAQWNR